MPTRVGASALLAALMLAVSSCDGDDNGTGPTGATSATGATGTQVEEGCNEDRPYRSENTGRLAGFFRACVGKDRTSVEVINTSSTVLTVKTADAPLDMVVTSVQASSFSDAAVEASVKSGCSVATTGPCRLPPNSQLVAEGIAPVKVLVDLDAGATAIATGAASLANFVASKLTSPGRQFLGSIRACAEQIGNLTHPNEFLEDAVHQAIDYGTNCGGLLQRIADALGEPPQPAETANEVLRSAGSFTANLRRDLYAFSAIRVIARLR